MQENLAAIRQRVLDFWTNSPPMVRYITLSTIGVALVALMAAVGYSYRQSQKQVMVALFMELDAKDAMAIKTKLDDQKIPYEFRDVGKSIYVPKEVVVGTRLSLAAENLPKSGTIGYELMDQQSFATTDFTQQVNLRRALEGELSRTIEGLDAVENARVHISMDEPSLFVDSSEAATATVALKLKPKMVLEDEQIKSVVHMVSHSVKGLVPDKVTVVDQKGNLLSDVLKEEGNQKKVAQLKKMQMELKNREEDRLQEKVQSMLEKAFGEDKVVTRVTVEMDFDQEQSEAEIYQPVVEEAGIPRSSQSIKEEFTGVGAPPEVGVPGTTSNIPGYKEMAQGNNQYKRAETTTNFEVSKTVTRRERDPGVIHRVSVAVMLDAPDREFAQDRVALLRQNVAAAGGLDLRTQPQGRGDQVDVYNMNFNDKYQRDLEAERLAQQQAKQRQMMVYTGLLVGGILLAGLLTILLMRGQKLPEVVEEAEETGVDPFRLEPVELPVQPVERVVVSPSAIEVEARDLEAELAAEAAFPEPAMSDEEQAAQKMRDAVFGLVDTNPEAAATIIKNWLMEED